MFLGHLRCLIGDINNHCQNIDADAAELELRLQFTQFSLLNAEPLKEFSTSKHKRQKALSAAETFINLTGSPSIQEIPLNTINDSCQNPK